MTGITRREFHSRSLAAAVATYLDASGIGRAEPRPGTDDTDTEVSQPESPEPSESPGASEQVSLPAGRFNLPTPPVAEDHELPKVEAKTRLRPVVFDQYGMETPGGGGIQFADVSVGQTIEIPSKRGLGDSNLPGIFCGSAAYEFSVDREKAFKDIGLAKRYAGYVKMSVAGARYLVTQSPDDRHELQSQVLGKVVRMATRELVGPIIKQISPPSTEGILGGQIAIFGAAYLASEAAKESLEGKTVELDFDPSRVTGGYHIFPLYDEIVRVAVHMVAKAALDGASQSLDRASQSLYRMSWRAGLLYPPKAL